MADESPPPNHYFLKFLGYGFLLAGIAGLFLPFLQGVLFILIGLLLLSRQERWARRMLARLRMGHPEWYGWVRQAREKVRGWLKRD